MEQEDQAQKKQDDEDSLNDRRAGSEEDSPKAEKPEEEDDHHGESESKKVAARTSKKQNSQDVTKYGDQHGFVVVVEEGKEEQPATVRYSTLQQKLQELDERQSSPDPSEPLLYPGSPEPDTSPAAGSYDTGTNQQMEGIHEQLNQPSLFQPAQNMMPAPYDLYNITEEDHSAQMSDYSRLTGMLTPSQYRQQNLQANSHKFNSSNLLDGARLQEADESQRMVLFDRSQSSQMNGFSYSGDGATRN